MSVFPRAIRQNTPQKGIAEFKSYATIDKIKNRTGRTNLFEYYNLNGDTILAEIELMNFKEDYPENFVVRRVDSLANSNKFYDAVELGKKMIKRNPVFSASYFAVGTEYLVLKKLDSAIHYLEIAYALSPHNPDIVFGLATAHASAKNDILAKTYYKKAISLGLDTIDVRLIFDFYPELKR